MTKEEARAVLMDTFRSAWCPDCTLTKEVHCASCPLLKVHNEAVETLEGENHDCGVPRR